MKMKISAMVLVMCVLALFQVIALADEQRITITAITCPGSTLACESVQVAKGDAVDLNEVFAPSSPWEGCSTVWTGADGAAIPGGIVTVQSDMTVTAAFSIAIPEEQPLGGNLVNTAVSGGWPETNGKILSWSMFTLCIAACGAILSLSHGRHAHSLHG